MKHMACTSWPLPLIIIPRWSIPLQKYVRQLFTDEKSSSCESDLHIETAPRVTPTKCIKKAWKVHPFSTMNFFENLEDLGSDVLSFECNSQLMCLNMLQGLSRFTFFI